MLLPKLWIISVVVFSFTSRIVALGAGSLDLPQATLRKALPDKILVSYTSNKCNDLDDMTKVTKAVEDGVNVLIWVFIKFESKIENKDGPSGRKLRIQTSQNVPNFRLYKQKLRDMGYGHVLNLVAFGGWNGQHLPSGYTANELYDVFHDFNFDNSAEDPLFDGIDWDLEGHDDPKSPTNVFTKECLDQMGMLSEKLKKDGFIVSLAPPESYMDITTQKFSRFVNLTYPEPWHEDFEYHGRNVYAYILGKWPCAIDFIFVQFYESYSHAAYQISEVGEDPSQFLVSYLKRLDEEGYFVHFENDPSVGLKNQNVQFPLTKLVLGFANGWALNQNVGVKTVFFDPFCIKEFYRRSNLAERVRGLGFWVIEEEGKHGIEYAKELKEIIEDSQNENSVNLETS